MWQQHMLQPVLLIRCVLVYVLRSQESLGSVRADREASTWQLRMLQLV
jgi:hypothetical protein